MWIVLAAFAAGFLLAVAIRAGAFDREPLFPLFDNYWSGWPVPGDSRQEGDTA